jgi:hypothetical protein
VNSASITVILPPLARRMDLLARFRETRSKKQGGL